MANHQSAKKRNPYNLVLVAGLISLFGFQALINIASQINLQQVDPLT